MKFSRLRSMAVALSVLMVAVALAAFLLFKHSGPGTPINPVVANNAAALTLMDFGTPPVVKPTTLGWFHIQFLTKPAMQISFGDKDGRSSLRCETNASGSIFGRFTDIDLAVYPTLKWSWLVEVPVLASAVEDSKEGDDHPVRYLVQLEDTQKATHEIEIIWSNGKYKKGEWKIIGNFYHYVADGGDAKSGENIGKWRDEEVNLLELYRFATKREDVGRLKYISVFCDTDDTKSRSIAYVGKTELLKAK